MARKKNDSAGGVLLIILICIAAILILAPLVIIIYGIYVSFKINRYQPKPTKISDFWLDLVEKQKFELLMENLYTINHAIDRAHSMAAQHNISVNKDGSYNKRSNKGKEICLILDKYNPLKNKCIENINYLRFLPSNLWNNYSTLLSHHKSCYFSIASWVLGFIGVCYYYKLDAISTFTNYITFKSSNHMVFIISGVISMVIFFLCDFIIKQGVANILPPKPPIVSMENLNEY
ncbi:hypothetical protein RHO12_03110 [Orbus sturtevantii]|uniref:hypothetical protein n=1 Tax=Orbus sturtevantii TaxID=3074109 RepID=UPI00370DBE60